MALNHIFFVPSRNKSTSPSKDIIPVSSTVTTLSQPPKSTISVSSTVSTSPPKDVIPVSSTVTTLTQPPKSTIPVSSTVTKLSSTETQSMSNIWEDATLAMKCFEECANGKVSQKDTYIRLKAPDWIMNYVGLSSKPFGSRMEHWIRTVLNLTMPESTRHDAICNDVKIEIKCSRYWAPSTTEWRKETLNEDILNARFQHLEEDYDYKIILAVVLGTKGIRCWALSHAVLFGDMKTQGVVTRQGMQGYWFDLQPAMKKGFIGEHNAIYNRADLDSFITSL